MKKIIISLLILFFLAGFKTESYSYNNALLEYATGTWCQWCPCSHQIIQDILTNYPNTSYISLSWRITNGTVERLQSWNEQLVCLVLKWVVKMLVTFL
ncbi:MAG: hypothetical protein M3R36_05725 [Bacteroidota bacterium]|nr:hypothetical protein [Bacteroidota bacterium]